MASAVCFREIYDVTIDDDTGALYLALEWWDITLPEIKYCLDSVIYILIREVLKAILNSCVILDAEGCVNTGMLYELEKCWHLLISPDFKPANILLSDVDTSLITAKVGDLGLSEYALMGIIDVYLLASLQYFQLAIILMLSYMPCAPLRSSWARHVLCCYKPGKLLQCYFVRLDLVFWVSGTVSL